MDELNAFNQSLRAAFVLICYWQKNYKTLTVAQKATKNIHIKKLLVKCGWNRFLIDDVTGEVVHILAWRGWVPLRIAEAARNILLWVDVVEAAGVAANDVQDRGLGGAAVLSGHTSTKSWRKNVLIRGPLRRSREFVNSKVFLVP